jgi:MFS family permease
MALTMPAATTAVMDAAPATRGGTAAGLINTARQVGSALGVALAGSLVGERIGFVPGLHLALAVCGGAFLLGAVVTVAAVDRHRAHPEPAATGPAPGSPGAAQQHKPGAADLQHGTPGAAQHRGPGAAGRTDEEPTGQSRRGSVRMRGA